MKQPKKRRKNRALIFCVVILFIVCAGIAIFTLYKADLILSEPPSEAITGSAETPSVTDSIQVLRGVVKDTTMNTLTVQGEDNHEYYFGTDGVHISTGTTGVVIGNPVAISYRGKLDSNASVQKVELLSILCKQSSKMQSFSPKSAEFFLRQFSPVMDRW